MPRARATASPGEHETRHADPRFVITRQHRRFVEFADACRRDRYIGLCHGTPGVGKTLSARAYADWDTLEPFLAEPVTQFLAAAGTVPGAHTAFYTPTMTLSPGRLDKELVELSNRLRWLATEAGKPVPARVAHASSSATQLLIVDEAERLTARNLEQIRDHYDRSTLGLVLIGMPGIERRLARYPQLYSRVGFVHRYEPLRPDELTLVLASRWPHLHLGNHDDQTTADAVAAITRYTHGNFRLVDRLLSQVTRVLEINHLTTVTSDVVDAARDVLIIGAP